MRKILILVIICSFQNLYSLEWSPVGAEWYYDITYFASGNVDYLKVFCDSIVEYKGKECKKISKPF